jgi:hypothetical protein
MTKFTKENVLQDGAYLYYAPNGIMTPWGERKFIARFKHAKDGAGSFKTFLIKNFTVEEYFAEYDAGVAPLKIVEEKGYLLPHIKTWLKRDGYPVTKAGFEQYIQDGIDKRKAA